VSGTAVKSPVTGATDAQRVRNLLRAYEAWLKVDLCYQNFETELVELLTWYGPPGGGLWLAHVDDGPAGCVAARPLKPGEAEMKRLWVEPHARGTGLGQRLAETAVAFARGAGYRVMRLDTMPGRMGPANTLYRRLGFVETPAYYDTPIEESIFLALDL